MTFADVPSGASLFVDANTFVYHFSPHAIFGPACTDLLDRITQRDIAGSTSLDVVRDVAHRMMTVEAMSREGWPATGIAQRLRKHPAVVQSLSLFRQAVDEIPKPGREHYSPACVNRFGGRGIESTIRLVERRCDAGCHHATFWHR